MSTEVMKEWISTGSPRLNARIAGFLYLIVIAAAPFAQVFVRGKLVVFGDAAATTTNILAHESLCRLAGAADLIAFTCDAAVALILYQLLQPVSKSLALFAAVFRLLHVAVVALNTLNHFAPLVILGGAHFFAAFKPDQLQALALMSLGLHGVGYNIVWSGCGWTLCNHGVLWRPPEVHYRQSGVDLTESRSDGLRHRHIGAETALGLE